MILTAPFQNGHASTKGEGRNIWSSPLEALPPPERLPAEEAAERMFDDGFVQFPDLFTGDQVERLRQWMDACAGPDEEYEVKNWCFNRLLPARPHQDPMWLELMDRSPVWDCLALVLGADFVITGGSMWTTGKGRQMGLHVDHIAVSLPSDVLMDPRVRLPINTSSLHIGSWRAGRYPREEGDGWNGVRPRMLSLKAGGGMLFRHDLWHGAEMNSSSRRRYMIQVHFAIRRHALAYPPLTLPESYAPAVLASASARQRRMLGEESAPRSGY
jgi:hypothetical protein